MAKNWHEIWNKRQANFQNINMDDEQQVITELKRAAGFDFFGKNSGITFEEVKKNYQHIRDNLHLHRGGGRYCL